MSEPTKGRPKRSYKPRNNRNESEFFRGGFVRDAGHGLQSTHCKPERLPVPDPESVSENIQVIEASRTFPNVTSPLKARRTKLAVMGLSSDILDAGNVRYAQCLRLGASYRKARTKELFLAHGFVSSGVSALLASASLALAGARFLYEIAASGGPNTPELLKKASSLSDSSRQSELSAWELCAREAVIRKRNADNDKSLPWLISQSTVGEIKRGPGRPRKVHLLAETSQSAGA